VSFQISPAILHYIALAARVIGAVVVLVLLIIAVNYLRQARIGAYYIQREQARARGLRFLGAAVLLGLALAGLVAWSDRLGARSASVAKATVTPSPTPTVVIPTPTATSTPEEPTGTPVPRPTATQLPVPTATPSPTRIPPTDLPPTLLTPVPLAEPAAENASFGPVQFGAGYVDFQLTGLGRVFPLDVKIVHATFLVRNLNRNAVWTAAWYRDGKYVAGDPLVWTALPNTIGHVFYGPSGGYKPGKWELRLYIEDRLQQKAAFTILNATATPTITPTPTITATAEP
jgi:hypothetical protein